jgi:hypothetical protein
MNWEKTILSVVAGLVAAMTIDYQAFRSWKSFDEARSYDWGLALWRWFQGAVAGLVAGLGLVEAGL